MDPFIIPHSLKDIPLPPQKEYIEQLVEETAKFIRRHKWRIYFKLNPEAQSESKENFGFRSNRAPPSTNQTNYGDHWEDLKAFEEHIYGLIRKVKFKKFSNEYQQRLKEMVERIENCEDLIIAADKTSNFYRVKTDD